LRFIFKTHKLEQLFFEGKGRGRYPKGVTESFFDAMTVIMAMPDERGLYALTGYQPKKMKGKMKELHEIRLNRQYRLIYRIEEDGEGSYFLIIDLIDPHR